MIIISFKDCYKIILMHFFPSLHQTKKAKKATSFSNPLTGAFYSNREFLKNCTTVPRSISNLDHIKQIKHNSNTEDYNWTQIKNIDKKSSSKKQERKRIERQIVAVHATARMAEPVKKNINGSLFLNKRCIKSIDQDTLNQLSKLNISKTFDTSQTVSRLKNTNQLSSKSQASQNKFNNLFSFPDVQVLILDLLNVESDFRTKFIRINLQKYYRSFFKKELSGHFTEQFVSKVQHYIGKIYQKDKLDEPFDQQLYPIQLFTIGSRMSFMNKVLELQSKKTLTNQQNIDVIIKNYCIPSQQFRQSCLRDILLMLSLQVYEKFNCNRHEQYVLLNQDGTQIVEILQIKFSTRKLFLSSKKNSVRNYSRYLELIDQFYREGKKLNFNQNIKLNFRNRLANGKVDENHFNYSQNYEYQKTKRSIEVRNAQILLKKRVQTHRVNKFAPKQQSIYYQKAVNILKTQNQNDGQSNSRTLSNQNNVINESQFKKSGEPPQFWKQQNIGLSSSIQRKRSRSRSPTRSNSPQRVNSPSRSKSPERSHSSFRKSQPNQRQKLKQFLTDNKVKNLSAQLEKNFRDQFKDLVSKNDFINFNFNHDYKNRIMKIVLQKYFVHFNNKSDIQIDKIFKAIKAVSSNEVNRNTIGNQYQKNYSKESKAFKHNLPVISENKIQFEEKDENIQQSLSWEEFKNLKTTIACMQPKEVLMNFVAKYLEFNQFGELSKQQLFCQIQIILGEKIQYSVVQVIAEVIWSWFQANSIIQNGFIRRTTLQSWYQKYKIVYCMLSSLIFGTNHKTALDLAYQILL